MSYLLETNKKRQKKLNWFLVLYGAILWICQTGISAGAKCGRPGRTESCIYGPAGHAFNQSDVIRYSCKDEGLAILGVHERRCLWNGFWSDEMPVCCKLAKIERIETLPQHPDFDDTYLVDGDISTCVELLEYAETIWTGYLSSFTNVTAVRITVLEIDEVNIENIEVTIRRDDTGDDKKCATKKAGSETAVNSSKTLTLHCPAGTVGNTIYVKSYYQHFRMCEVSVLLAPDSSCLTPDIPLHGTGHLIVSENSVDYQFHCHPGYKRWGALLVKCQADGTWFPKSPKCDEIYCYTPENLTNGYIEYSASSKGIPYNGTVRYYCKEGYYLAGQPTIRCHKWNEWDYPIPKCKAKTPETSTVSTSTLSNNTLLTESWTETNGKTCEILDADAVSQGKWQSVNGSGSLRVLICPEGFHIEGSPAVTHCLSNGSRSHTSAICKKSFEGVWGSHWSPSLMLMAAVAAGAGTAIFIFCLSVTFLIIKKRRQTRANTTVFHLEKGYHDAGVSKKNVQREKHLVKSESYESIIERRSKSPGTNPRKPRSALPNIPLDADPVYAQPFESTPIKKVSTATVNGKDDLYNAHIYAEPVDSRTPNTISVNAPRSRIRTDLRESPVKVTVGNELPQTIPKRTENCQKNCAIYDSTDRTSHNSRRLLTNDKFHKYNDKAEHSALKKNIEYLELI